MKLLHLLHLSYFVVFGSIQIINADCDAVRNTELMENSFGPMIMTKLADQSETIKAAFQSGLEDQNGKLQNSCKEIMDDKSQEFHQVLEMKFEDQSTKFNDRQS